MDSYYFTGGYTEPTQMGSGEVVPGRCQGIGCYRLEGETGRLTLLGITPSTPNPSFVLAEGSYLYCVNELKEYQGVPGSTVSAYRIDRETGRLTFINRQFTCGADACHLTLTPDRRYLLAANFTGGSFCVLPVREDGGLEPASCVLRHRGQGVDRERQQSPHPHQTILSPNGKYVYVPDLGLDRLVCYRADWEKGWMLPEEDLDIPGIPGQGIRHGVFNQAGDRLYVMTEMACAVNVYAYEKEEGRAELLQVISARGENCETLGLGAAVRLHPNGRWLYVSVRRSDELAVFQIGTDGLLTLLQVLPSQGEIPRDFVIAPDGGFLLAGCQDTDNISVFSVHLDTGILTPVYQNQEAFCVTVLAPWSPYTDK